jgi:CheY-like chemotaxis protein
LVVDDADDTRLLYVTALGEAGYTVEQASNGLEAIERAARFEPDVIVMDLSMPVLDGWEATRRIRADPRHSGVHIIAVTSHATRYGIQDVRDAGAQLVLPKPCLPEDLLRAIAALLAGERGPTS